MAFYSNIIVSLLLLFLLAMFASSTHHRRNLLTYLEFWGNSGLETRAFYAKILIWKFDIFDLTLTWPPSKVNFDDFIGSNDHHYRYVGTRKITQKTCVARHVCDFYFLVTFCWPGLDLFRYDLCTLAVSFSYIYQHFVWVWALCCPSNQPYSPKCENSVFYFWPDFDLTPDLYLNPRRHRGGGWCTPPPWVFLK